MKLSRRRIWAVTRKELREYRRNRSVIWTMAIFPLVFCIQPLIVALRLPASASEALSHEHVLLYLLGIPALVPAFVAAYAVVGEREQGTLEPILTTPIPREEFLLGKALAALLPSLLISYVVFAAFLVVFELLAPAGIASALIQPPDLVAQLIFTPLLATWTIWVGIAISARSNDVRVAQQIGVLASLPAVFIVVLIAVNVIPVTPALAVGGAALLIVLDAAGWRITSRAFDREQLIIGTR